MNSKLEHNLRLYSGLVIAFFLVLHLLNAGLGIVSLPIMNSVGNNLFAFWSFPLFNFILYASFVIHISLMFVGLYRRRTLRMPRWNLLQFALALLLPLLLISHILGTRGAYQFFELTNSYTRFVTRVWSDPVEVVQQYALVFIAWMHMSIGIHYWLRHKAGYARWVPVLYPLGLFVPLFAALGFLGAGIESWQGTIAEPVEYGSKYFTAEELAQVGQKLSTIEKSVLWLFGILLLSVLAFRLIRTVVDKRKGGFVVRHAPSGKLISARPGQTVLESLREAGIQHTAICGGRGRCTTCKIRIAKSHSALAEPEELELRALKRIGAASDIRLACQLRPLQDVTITPLLQSDELASLARQPANVVGHEREITCMFVDMRDSTTLGEQKLPYDVVFILNQFFMQLDGALQDTGGHYATFTGDGLMALYGLEGNLSSGSLDALQGAVEIQRRIAQLNSWLAEELNSPIKVGIGIHCGDAIVGSMGPPEAPTVSALGDTVNIAARLEALSKEFNTGLVISEDVLHKVGGEHIALPRHEVNIRGREEPMKIALVDSPLNLLEQIKSK